MNLRPSGYEPDELPDCSTPRRGDREGAGEGAAGGVQERVVDHRRRRRSGDGARGSSPDLAATRSPTDRTAVPWALRSFTAEFGMGSGGASAL